jgi:hypothetical protein
LWQITQIFKLMPKKSNLKMEHILLWTTLSFVGSALLENPKWEKETQSKRFLIPAYLQICNHKRSPILQYHHVPLSFIFGSNENNIFTFLKITQYWKDVCI